MPPKENIERVKELLKIVDGTLTKEEFVVAFENLIKLVLKIEKRNSDAVEKLESTYAKLVADIKNDNTSSLDSLKKQVDRVFVEDRLEEMEKEITTKLESELSDVKRVIKNKLDSVKDGKSIKGDKGDRGRDGSPDTPEEVVEKVNRSSKKIKKSAIEGIEDLVGKQMTLVGGGRGMQLYVDGTKKGMVKTINLIGGTNISLAYSASYGRNDITINASASALSILTATGTVNGVNTDFTLVSKPTILISDGASYKENSGWTWNSGTLTATLSIPPSYDVYGLG